VPVVPGSGGAVTQERARDVAAHFGYPVNLFIERFQVLAAPNLNGDYLSDACAAQVGGPRSAGSTSCARWSRPERTHASANAIDNLKIT